MAERVRAQILAIENEIAGTQAIGAAALAPDLLSVASLRYLTEVESLLVRSALSASRLLLAFSATMTFLLRTRYQSLVSKFLTTMADRDFDEAQCLENIRKDLSDIEEGISKTGIHFILWPLLAAYLLLFFVLQYVIWVL